MQMLLLRDKMGIPSGHLAIVRNYTSNNMLDGKSSKHGDVFSHCHFLRRVTRLPLPCSSEKASLAYIMGKIPAVAPIFKPGFFSSGLDLARIKTYTQVGPNK
jgi:hypothetical protein